MPGFLSGINLTVLAVVGALFLGAAGLCVYLNHEVKTLTADLATARADLKIQKTTVDTTVQSCNDQIEKIHGLELQRQSNQAEVQSLEDRLDRLSPPDAIPLIDPPKDVKSNAQPTSFVDELNGINGDALRMLEQSSHGGLHAGAGN